MVSASPRISSGVRFPASQRSPEQGVLIEAAHDDDMVARGCRLVGAEAQIAVDALQDGAHFEIDLRGDAAVDLELALAHLLALFGRREIHIGKFDGALELVGVIADQEDDGAMGLDALDLRAGQAVMFGL